MAYPHPYHLNHPPYAAPPPPPPTGFPPAAFQIVIPPPAPYPQQYQNYPTYPPHRFENVPPPHHQGQLSQQPPLPPPGPAYVNNVHQKPLSPPHAAAPSRPVPPKPPSPPPIDHEVLLLSLAEEYFEAAHGRGPLNARAGREELDRYYKLVATGLACLESVLKNFRPHPRTEALVRLRYATILHEETENMWDAEVALNKGISLCDRNRLLDIKYSMQHLLARILFKKSPKAGTKALDGMIQDVEAYQHIPWVYAFRFLRTSLSLEIGTPNEMHSALQSLRAISETASHRGDDAISIAAANLEALAHLRSGGDGAIEQAQRALASARSLQLSKATHEQTQLITLTHILDLVCSLMESNPMSALPKMDALKAIMDQDSGKAAWSKDGTFSVPVARHQSSGSLTKSSGGIFTRGDDSNDFLVFTWLPARDVYALSFFLCGVAMSHRNSLDGHKAEKFLQEGIKMAGGKVDVGKPSNAEGARESLSVATSRQAWRRLLRCYMQLHLVLLLCGRSDWTLARKLVDELRRELQNLDPPTSTPLDTFLLYIEGVIQQGNGDVSAALSTFQNSCFYLPEDNGAGNPAKQIQCDLAILAALNSVFILHGRSQAYNSTIETLISTLEHFCLSHPNRNIQCGFQLIKATTHPSDPMIRTKHYMQNTLKAAKAIANTQLSCMILHFVSWKFFTGVVGDQAEKSVRAAWQLAKRGDNDLWISVAEGMMADTLEVQGKTAEARAAREGALRLATALGPKLQPR
ncbi:MAG: hypothetical protein M1833_001476 [Piccolia ochrophora]|nr:MAG: hypothetical protein M1833_001476 [Piccolia ochrophora]